MHGAREFDQIVLQNRKPRPAVCQLFRACTVDLNSTRSFCKQVRLGLQFVKTPERASDFDWISLHTHRSDLHARNIASSVRVLCCRTLALAIREPNSIVNIAMKTGSSRGSRSLLQHARSSRLMSENDTVPWSVQPSDFLDMRPGIQIRYRERRVWFEQWNTDGP